MVVNWEVVPVGLAVLVGFDVPMELGGPVGLGGLVEFGFGTLMKRQLLASA